MSREPDNPSEYATVVRSELEIAGPQSEAGSVCLQLRRPREDPPGPNSVTFAASYVHLGIWRETTKLICSW